MKHYYFADNSAAFDSLSGVAYEAIHFAGGSFGWVNWEGGDRTKFESRNDVHAVGTLAHPRVPAVAASKLAAHGVSPNDTALEAAEKIRGKFGGFCLDW